MKAEGRSTVLIAAYGTLMSGECNHHICGNVCQITPCVIYGTLYDTHRGYPAFVPGGAGSVAAELIEIPEYIWPEIDALEEYPLLYTRELITVELADRNAASAWVYVMRQLPGDATWIVSGDWRRRGLH